MIGTESGEDVLFVERHQKCEIDSTRAREN